jgi:hypothetical protein
MVLDAGMLRPRDKGKQTHGRTAPHTEKSSKPTGNNNPESHDEFNGQSI